MSVDKRFYVAVLPYEMRDIAVNKELICEYADGHIYVKDKQGRIISKTLDIEGRVNVHETPAGGDKIGISVNGLTATKLNAGLDEIRRYAESLIQGITMKKAVRVYSETNSTLSGVPSQPVDGITLKAGDRILLNGQTDKRQNGPWIIKTGTWERSEDFRNGTQLKNSAYMMVLEGTKYKDSSFILITDGDITIGTTNLQFQQFSSLGQIEVGSELEKTGHMLNLKRTGVTEGTFTKLYVNEFGRVTAAETPTKFIDLGITDAVHSSHVGSTGSAHGAASESVSGFMTPVHVRKQQALDAELQRQETEHMARVSTKVGGRRYDLQVNPTVQKQVTIVDRLDSTSSADALSSNQGNVLKGFVDDGPMNKNATNAVRIKTWIGTQEEYDSIATIDMNTMYHII